MAKEKGPWRGKTVWFRCSAILPNGKRCPKKFATLKQLEDHANREHPNN